MMQQIIFVMLIVLASLNTTPCLAQQDWEFKLSYESKALVNSPFFLFTSADMNKNGTKELIVTDFGRFGDHIEEWQQWKEVPTRYYDVFVIKWEHGELKSKFHKRWDMKLPKTRDERDQYFMAYDARQIKTWEIANRVIVETIPPYLSVEWQNDKYVLREQQGWAQKEPLVGSWVFPWLSPSCYQGFPNKRVWPQECLVGIRDFSGKGAPKIVTILEEEVAKDRQYKQTIRVRKFAPGFPIEWEQRSPMNFVMMDPIDRYNFKSASPILLRIDRTAKWYIFEPDEQMTGYRVRDIHLEGSRGLETFDLPDYYLRKSKSKENEAYWGYRRIDLSDSKRNYFKLLLKKVMLSPDLSGFLKEDVDFPHHDHFLGVGYFDLQDIDGDGLDEVILVEETGKVTFGDETASYENIKDYIHILKWDGTKYRTMWVSPPYTKRGAKFLVEDIKNTGKKQLVVLAPNGIVQIWERQ